MGFPAAPTESGSAKIHFLTTTGNVAAGWAAIDTATSDSGGNTLGFAAIATHVEGDAVGAPGGIDTTSVPVVLVAGDDGTNAVPLQLSGSDLKVTLDGETVTETNSGSIKTAVELLDNAIDGNYLNVNANIAGVDFVGGAGAVAAGVQRTTLASDDPAVALLGTMDADTGAIKTAVELIDNAVAGSELQVDVVAALPAGTNAIGKLAANSGVDIGDVDVTSVPAPLSTTGGGAEAAALRVTLANDSTGVVTVDDGGSAITVDWAGTAPPIGAGVEATALRVTIATDSTGVVSVDDNGGSLSIDDGGNTITIDGSVSDNGPGFTVIYKYLAKNTTADATLWDPTANYLHVTDVIISISGTATDVTLGFGAGTDLEETFLKFHGDVRGGLTHHFRAPIKSTDSGDNLNIALSAAQAMTITICGYESAT